jgi:diguanylate cyclase (GGDEF)-like protein
MSRSGPLERGEQAAWRWRGLLRAERLVAPLRVVVGAVNLVAWVAVVHPPGNAGLLAWVVGGVAIARALGEAAVLRWRSAWLRRVPWLSPALDFLFVLLWLAATGGPRSPFAPTVFLALAPVLRLPRAGAVGGLMGFTAVAAAILGPRHALLLAYFLIVAFGLYAWVLRTQEERWRADTDSLTDLFNHRYMSERLLAELEAARQRGAAGQLYFLDLDGFKLFNDTYGHPAGDRVLRAVAESLRQAIPAGAVVGRFGGDEFVVLWPRPVSPAEARAVGERLRDAVASVAAGLPAGIPLTASVGVASYPRDGQTLDALLGAADKALAAAKRSGGNAVAFADSEVPRLLASYGPTLTALASLALAVESKDRRTAQHADAAARLAGLLGRRLGFEGEDERQLRLGAVLHDLGKIGIPDAILLKPGPLTDEEWAVMRRHPELGYMILKEVPGIELAQDIVLHHHERWDGRGYPHGLRGEEISLAARIVSVVDAFTAMTSDRPYRRALSVEAALEELRRHAGTQFDPAVVLALEALVQAPDQGRAASPSLSPSTRSGPESRVER